MSTRPISSTYRWVILLAIAMVMLSNFFSYTSVTRSVSPLLQHFSLAQGPGVSIGRLEKVGNDTNPGAVSDGSRATDHLSTSKEETESLIEKPLESKQERVMRSPKFFIIPTPEITTSQIIRDQTRASSFYETTLNEELAEIWLHRGFERMTYEEGHTNDPAEADVFLIAGYLHLSKLSDVGPDYTDLLVKRIHNKTKPHVFLCPTWNPGTSRSTGITKLIRHFMKEGVNTWSVGFERNSFWQVVKPARIIPIPYVVKPSFSKEQLRKITASKRVENFVFYAGDSRKHAIQWAGCNRSMVTPLSNVTNMDVSIRGKRNRISQEEYNTRMFTSDYCLILCGDTVTSRSLTSAVVYGCIPVRVGSRLRGLCELPCHNGWGWTVSGEDFPHLPYPHSMDWQLYPEVNEADFSAVPLATLQEMFRSVTPEKKAKIRDNMHDMQMGWIYGWGDPVTSKEFGDATDYVWKSIVSIVDL